MSERETILGRIREALTVEAPKPGSHGRGMAQAHTSTGMAEWLPQVGITEDEQIEQFRRNSNELRTDFRVVDSMEQCVQQLCELANEQAWKSFGSHRGELSSRVAEQIGLPICFTDGGYDVAELESCDAAITECDALIAQTGSVLVTSRSAGGRALSVLPPHHVAIARIDQLIPDLVSAFELLESRYGGDYPSFISFITGPSRTGDIERILVLGAHGPKQLTVFCLREV